MLKTHDRSKLFPIVLCTMVVLQACGHKSSPAAAEHIRGTVQSLDGQVLTVATPGGSVPVQLEGKTAVGAVVKSSRDHLTDGSFLGITSVTDSDGRERAVEVHVFPEAMRGTGEGSYGWDLPGRAGSRMSNGTAASSRMTNGTVATSRMTNGTVTAAGGASTLTLTFKNGGSGGGSQTIAIPSDIPIVAIEPGQIADLQQGAHVFVIAHRTPNGALTADRILAGKDGVVPPM